MDYTSGFVVQSKKEIRSLEKMKGENF